MEGIGEQERMVMSRRVVDEEVTHSGKGKGIQCVLFREEVYVMRTLLYLDFLFSFHPHHSRDWNSNVSCN